LVLRWAAGVLEVVPPSEHGVSAFGDHRGLVAVRDGADVRLVFGRNNDRLHAWRRRPR
jgi:hypothetical protein